MSKTEIGTRWVANIVDAEPGSRVAVVVSTHRRALQLIDALVKAGQQAPKCRRTHRMLLYPNGSQVRVYCASEELRGIRNHAALVESASPECASARAALHSLGPEPGGRFKWVPEGACS